MWRATTGLAALTLGTFGVLAVFRTENGAGATTLLVVAALFGLVTVLGFVPRLKFGDAEVDPGFAAVIGAIGALQDLIAKLESKAPDVDPVEVARDEVEERIEQLNTSITHSGTYWVGGTRTRAGKPLPVFNMVGLGFWKLIPDGGDGFLIVDTKTGETVHRIDSSLREVPE